MPLIRWCLKNSLLLNLLSIAVLSIGVYKTISMNKEAFPAIDFDLVAISTIYPGASALEVEQFVTDLIEDELKGIGGIERVESSSKEGHSLVLCRIDPELPETGKVKTQNDIQKAIDRIRGLPDEIEDAPKVESADSGDMPIIEVAVSGDNAYAELVKVAEDLKEEFEDIPDIKTAEIRYFREKEFWVEVSPQKLSQYNVGLASVIGTLKQRSASLPGGIIKTPGGEILVRTLGEAKSADEIANIVLRVNTAGNEVRIKDIGSVRPTFEDQDISFRTNQKPSINILVTKKPRGDILELTKRAKVVAKRYSDDNAIRGIEIKFFNDASTFVRNRLGVLLNNGYIGIGLVLIVLLIFLSKGIALVAAVGMPVALFGCLMVMGYMGLTVNLISMFALVIVLGMLVDDAIIVAENIWQYYENGENAWDAALKGTREVLWPVTATILTTIAAFSPMMMVSGIFGKFIQIVPQVVIIALIASLIEAMFVLPSHAYDLLKWSDKKHSSKAQHNDSFKAKSTLWVTQKYVTSLEFSLRFRYLFVTGLFVVFGYSIWFAQNKMETILFPREGIESFFVRVNLPEKTPLDKTTAALMDIEVAIKSLPKTEVNDILTFIGTQKDDPQDPFTKSGPNLGQIQVFLTPEKDRIRNADRIIEDLRKKFLETEKKHHIERIFFSLIRTGPPVGKPVAIRIRGDDLSELLTLSGNVQKALQGIAGVSDVSDNYQEGAREFHIKVDEMAAAKYLLSAKDIALHVRTAIEGQIATYVRLDGERIAVRVRYPHKQRENLDFLLDSQILNQAGLLIPLKNVATFENDKGLKNILHYGYKRTVTVTASIDEDLTSSSSVNKALLPTLSQLGRTHPKVKFETGGEYEDTDDSMKSLQEAFGVALALIFLILATQFRSLTQPFVVMMAIPFGSIGVIASFWFHDLPLSFMGMVGFIGLSGVVVNDSIVLVDFINQAILRGMPIRDAIVYAAGRRFRAVWLTTMTTVFGLLPLVYGFGGEDKFLMPAAAALGYGLIFGTVLILYFVPLLYLVRGDIVSLLRRTQST